MSAAEPHVISYSVEMIPPAYPDRLHPWTCKHGPVFEVQANVCIVNEGGRNRIEIDHRVCLGCGAPIKVTVGGNVLVDLSEVCRQQAMFLPLFQRAWHLRSRWTRVALKLFGPDGWNGRHERVARTIDPNLTMRLEAVGDGLGRCWFDASYVRLEREGHDDEQAHGAPEAAASKSCDQEREGSGAKAPAARRPNRVDSRKGNTRQGRSTHHALAQPARARGDGPGVMDAPPFTAPRQTDLFHTTPTAPEAAATAGDRP